MDPQTNRVLAVDIGTSSVRAIVYDVNGNILARAQICYPVTRPAPYFEEQDPDLVRAEVYRAIRLCLAAPEAEPERIAAIGFSSQMYGVIALGEDEKPLTKNILWSDGRAEAQAEKIKKNLGEQWLYPETGCPMNSIFPFAKLVWLSEMEQEIFYLARRFVSIKEYITYPLIGEWMVDYSMASGTGMLNIRTHQWSARALEHIGVGVKRFSKPVSGIQKFLLQSKSPLAGCGLPENVGIFLGGGDGPLANLGSAAVTAGSVNIDLGTSGAARCLVGEPKLDDTASLWCFCLTDDLWAYGGIVTNAGNAYQWLGTNVPGATGQTEKQSFELMDRLASQVEPGAEGLYFLPYLRKVRSPYWDGRLKGTLYGLTAAHSLGHMARALLEAVAFDMRTIVDIMQRKSTRVSHIVLTGGLSKSPIIPQLFANVLNHELRVPEDGEGSVAGAAILALRGLGLIDGLAFAGESRAYKSYLPDRASSDRYECVYRRYIQLVDALREINLLEKGLL
ncbi:gluconate kinase [Betaproteobacteria bacterium]|nr:gluconate kinase [Betaproteobacteria bacterium]